MLSKRGFQKALLITDQLRESTNERRLYKYRECSKEDLREIYLMHRVVSHGAVVVRLRAVITAVYSHAVSGHVLRSSGWRRRHHRRRGALAGTAHAVWRCSCKSCCRNNRGAYKIRRCDFLSATAIFCLSVSRALMLLLLSKDQR